MSENYPEKNVPPITADGVEYNATFGETEFGWCWCTDGQHGTHAVPRLGGWGPVWAGTWRYAKGYYLTVLDDKDRKTTHRIKRLCLVFRSAAEESPKPWGPA